MDVRHGREITLSHSQETLRRLKENDESLKNLWIGGTVYIDRDDQGNEVVEVRFGDDRNITIRENSGVFNPSNDSEFSSLGEYVARNTHLTRLVHVDGRVGLDAECLRHHSSIHQLILEYEGHDISDAVTHDILKVYQEKSNLSRLGIQNTNLRNGGVDTLVNTLKSCRDLKRIFLYVCNLTDEQLLPILEAIRCHRMLEKLLLSGNHIGNVGCGAIATLLDNPNCNLQHLDLLSNNIGNEGAITIANSLANNTTLQKLILSHNPFDQSVVEESFCKVLCNTSSINSTYSSNHMLKKIVLTSGTGPQLVSLLKINKGTNKSHVAMKKILKYHPNIDMGPMFEWDAEDEQSLKALPYVISWFERAGKAVSAFPGYNIEEQKLDAIFQFARAMPLLFVPASPPNDKAASNNKRKRAST